MSVDPDILALFKSLAGSGLPALARYRLAVGRALPAWTPEQYERALERVTQREGLAR